MRILFVCLGNICRSPMAEAVMRHKLENIGRGDIVVDSAGTSGWHVGEPPFKGTRDKLRNMNISDKGIRARAFTQKDFLAFDYIIGLDRQNVTDIKGMDHKGHHDKIHLLSAFVPDATWVDVPDPWYTGDFDLAYALIDSACNGLLAQLMQKEKTL